MACKRAAAQLSERHEILRTYFQRVPGRVFPVQVVHDTLPPEWHEIDLELLSPEAQSDCVREFLNAELPSAFCVEKGPLFRVALVRLSVHKRLCCRSACLRFAPIRASLRTLVREMVALYLGEQADLNRDPLQYADLADWQNELLENESSGEAGYAYWRQQIPGRPRCPSRSRRIRTKQRLSGPLPSPCRWTPRWKRAWVMLPTAGRSSGLRSLRVAGRRCSVA